MKLKTNMKNIYYLVFTCLLLLACNKNRIIPEKDMVTIVTKIFMTDAISVTLQTEKSLFSHDSIEYYAPIYKSLGYTTNQFDSSIVYYTRNPEALNRIIDKAINELSRKETEIKAKIAAMDSDSLDTTNLWVGKRKWILPADGERETIDFKIPISSPGTYTLTAMIRLLPNDEALEPKIQFGFTLSNDSTNVNFVSEKLLNDGLDRLVKITSTINDSRVTHIAGSILHHEKKEGKWSKRAEVSAIKIDFTPINPNEPEAKTTQTGIKLQSLDEKR
jgi:hypothetical protein